MYDNKKRDDYYDSTDGIKATHENCGVNVLENARKANGMTQQQVANIAKINLGALSDV